MFRLMSGIFANSLHGREFCFERLSACKCRSPRKSPPGDYVRKPPAVELGKSSPKTIRLWELMEQGCSCPKKTAKERWFSTNQHIILTLAQVLDRPPDAVSNFLYQLTLQNFSKIMNPWAAPGSHCKVPLAYPNACEDYMRLFDTHGNIRSRFDNDSLMLLMRVMQAWLKRGARRNLEPFDPCVGAAQCRVRSGTKARRAGIDSDSIAHRNGRRRLKESDERACLIRSNLLGYSAKGCPKYLYGPGNDSSAAQRSPLASGDPGHVFGKHFVPRNSNDGDQDDHLGGLGSYVDDGDQDFYPGGLGRYVHDGNQDDHLGGLGSYVNDGNQDDHLGRLSSYVDKGNQDDHQGGLSSYVNDGDQDDYLGGLGSYADELAAERARRLEDLLFRLNARTYLTRDAYFLIEAIKGIQVGPPQQKSARKPATDKSSAKTITDSYYKILRESEIGSGLKIQLHNFGKYSSPERHLLHASTNDSSQQRNQSNDFGKDSSPKGHRKHHSQGTKDQKPETQPVASYNPTYKLYDGASIPVLMHEPYSQEKPWTWLNRHPHPARINDRGSIVKDKHIRRYRRSTVSGQMQQARERGSVYSIYSIASATEVPMFGRRSVSKPATRKSLTWQSQVRRSIA